MHFSYMPIFPQHKRPFANSGRYPSLSSEVKHYPVMYTRAPQKQEPILHFRIHYKKNISRLTMLILQFSERKIHQSHLDKGPIMM